MAGEVKLYQIYWKADQLPNMYPFSTPLLNEGLTYFFENSIIAEVVPREKADKIGVCSWQLRQKIGNGVPMKRKFTREVIEGDYEVLSLCRKMPEHRMLFLLDQWHPGARAILEQIFLKLGFEKPTEPKNPIYQNHFMATRQIYQDYVGQMLIPAMKIMMEDPEIAPLCMQDSQYFKLQPPYGEYAARVQKFFGFNYAPLHAFLCERMFSCWINNKPIKVSYL